MSPTELEEKNGVVNGHSTDTEMQSDVDADVDPKAAAKVVGVENEEVEKAAAPNDRVYDAPDTSASGDDNSSNDDTTTTTTAENDSLKAKPLRLFEDPPAFQPSSIKVAKEITRLEEVVAESSKEAVQALLREHWKEFLFEEDAENHFSIHDHVSFVLRAGISNASAEVVDAFTESSGRHPKFIASVLSRATPDQLEEYVPTAVLDEVLKERLQTVPATDLIRYLAEADRLGYSLDDIIENDDENNVRPNMSTKDPSEDVEMVDHLPEQPQHQQYQQQQPVEMDPVQAANTAARNAAIKRSSGGKDSILTNARQMQQLALSSHRDSATSKVHMICDMCNMGPFHSVSGFTYHVTKKVCQKGEPPGGFKSACSNCAQGFTTRQGLNYHNLNRVCEGEITPATPVDVTSKSPSAPLQQEAVFESKLPLTQTPVPLPLATQPPPQVPSMPPMYTPQHRVPIPPRQEPAPLPRLVNNFTTPLSRPISQTPSQDRSSSGTRRQQYADSPETRVTPNSLPPEKYAELNRKIDEAEQAYRDAVKAVEADTTISADLKVARLASLKNGNASKKSNIRKSYGVSLRLRDKDKQAMKAKGLKIDYPKQDNFRPSKTNGTNGHSNGTKQTSHYIDPHHPSSSRDSPASGYDTPTTSFTPLNRSSAGALNRLGVPGNHEGFGMIRKSTENEQPTSREQSYSTPHPNKRRRTSTPSDPSRPASSHSNRALNRVVPMHSQPDSRFDELRHRPPGSATENGKEKEVIEVLSSGDEESSNEREDGVNGRVAVEEINGKESGERGRNDQRRGSGMAKRGGRRVMNL